MSVVSPEHPTVVDGSGAPPDSASAASPRSRSIIGTDASPARQNVQIALIMIVAIACGLLLEAVIVSGLQHRAAQSRAFAAFRKQLALGTAPIGQLDRDGHLLKLGTPVALIEARTIGLHEVVGEGTTSSVLAAGPGHSRTTALPGQAGTSVILGRCAAFGGPFKGLRSLKPGDVIQVSTAQGTSQYKVLGVRRRGDPLPPNPAAGKGRLILVTADGPPLRPSGVLYVDADLMSPVFDANVRGRAVLAQSEQPLGTDGSSSWALVLWMQALVLFMIGAMWSWSRWGRRQTWIVFAPAILLATIGACGGFLKLLPNLT